MKQAMYILLDLIFLQVVAAQVSHMGLYALLHGNNRRSCPTNHVYYNCKPCAARCQEVPLSSDISHQVHEEYLKYKENVKIEFYKRPCQHRECHPGCGCPTATPYVDEKGHCFQLNIQCPVNLHALYQRYRPLQSESPEVRHIKRHRYEAEFDIIQHPHLAEGQMRHTGSSKTINPSVPPIEQQGMRFTNPVTPAVTKSTCPFGQVILRRESCDCDGEFVEQDCIGAPLCPFKCVKRARLPKCPDDRLIFNRSSCECDGELVEPPCFGFEVGRSKCPVRCTFKAPTVKCPLDSVILDNRSCICDGQFRRTECLNPPQIGCPFECVPPHLVHLIVNTTITTTTTTPAPKSTKNTTVPATKAATTVSSTVRRCPYDKSIMQGENCVCRGLLRLEKEKCRGVGRCTYRCFRILG